jgi:hypothetical protein
MKLMLTIGNMAILGHACSAHERLACQSEFVQRDRDFGARQPLLPFDVAQGDPLGLG